MGLSMKRYTDTHVIKKVLAPYLDGTRYGQSSPTLLQYYFYILGIMILYLIYEYFINILIFLFSSCMFFLIISPGAFMRHTPL